MSGPNRKREVQVNFRVSPQELEMIEQKMAQLGTSNREAYLRKMAQDGSGRLCGEAGTAGVKGAGLPDALFQQQLKPVDPPCA